MASRKLFRRYFVAVYNGHVASIFPYISDTGALPPESCIFAQLLNIGSLIGTIHRCITVYLRQRQLEEVQVTFRDARQKWTKRLNYAMACIGYLACLGISLVANFQEENVQVVHYIGALMAFLFGLIYGFGQTILSYVVDRFIVTICVAHLRFILTVMSALFFGLMFSHNMTAEKLTRGTPLPFVHRKSNETAELGSNKRDKRFLKINLEPNLRFHSWIIRAYNWYLVSAFSEWGFSITVILFFITFAVEFRKIIFHSPRVILHEKVTVNNKNNSNRTKITETEILNADQPISYKSIENQYSNLVSPTYSKMIRKVEDPERNSSFENQNRSDKYPEIRLPRVVHRKINNCMTIGPNFHSNQAMITPDRSSKYYRSFDYGEPFKRVHNHWMPPSNQRNLKKTKRTAYCRLTKQWRTTHENVNHPTSTVHEIKVLTFDECIYGSSHIFQLRQTKPFLAERNGTDHQQSKNQLLIRKYKCNFLKMIDGPPTEPNGTKIFLSFGKVMSIAFRTIAPKKYKVFH
uniref:Gustatory receptor n=1 Tax=Romanomermis culicivorax TaxID=13658 RepID=A0A915KWV7_ROMCU